MTNGQKNIDLSPYGISDVKEIYHNLSYVDLYKHETNPSLEGFERGYVTESGAVAVDTGIFTGRSPKDKYIVREDQNEKNIWWKNEQRKSSDNKPISEEVWKDLYALRFLYTTGHFEVRSQRSDVQNTENELSDSVAI